MIVERRVMNAAIVISESRNDGYLVTRTFIDYTEEEAIAIFREEFPEEWPGG